MAESEAIEAPSTSWGEFAIVLGGPLCLALFAQLVLYPTAGARHFSNYRIVRTLIVEVIYGTLIAAYLYRKGWRLRDVSHPFTRRDLLRGVAVWVFAYLVVWAGLLLAFVLWSDPTLTAESAPFTSSVALPLVLLLAVINPIFEEGLWTAYVANGPARDRPAMAYLLSVACRTLVHSYQGWLAIISIAPLGLWFFRYYMRTRRLGPVIVAHALQDLTALLLAGVARGAV